MYAESFSCICQKREGVAAFFPHALNTHGSKAKSDLEMGGGGTGFRNKVLLAGMTIVLTKVLNSWAIFFKELIMISITTGVRITFKPVIRMLTFYL